MKALLGIIAVFIVGAVAYAMWTPANTTELSNTNQEVSKQETASDTRTVVTEGSYTVRTEESTVTWAGKKPLIDGYVNSGSIGLSNGMITVADATASGDFTLDMTTLSVSETPTKPGQESKLEEHLTGERWFNVAAYPTAKFTITDVAPRVDSDTTFVYDITGDLTMKDQTHSITFPATINMDAAGDLHAKASFEIDRTKWGITSGSGSFFDNLADNVIDDMVALSFHLVAGK